MYRFIASLVAVASVAYAFAQAPFTIVRPADGSKVREVVHVLFPLNSVPEGGYVGIFVNGKFIEATMPVKGAHFLDYALDTKALGLPDGPTTIEAVLYMNFSEKPRIMDRSSVQVTLANKANIDIPERGYLLRYHFRPNEELVYDFSSDLTHSSISLGQAALGGHAAETPIEDFHGRMVYGVDNTYSDGDALVRMLMQTPPGKSAMLVGFYDQPQPRAATDESFYPVYMRIHNTGEEVYGLIPTYFPFPGSSPANVQNPIFVTRPLPSLPFEAVKPGDTWITRIQMPSDANGAQVEERNSLVNKIPARGEFVDVEWEMGHPCAKIHDTFEVGAGGPGQGAEAIKNNARAVDETFWYALDRGVVLKIVRTITQDQRVEAPTSNTGRMGGNGAPGGAYGSPGTGPGFGPKGALRRFRMGPGAENETEPTNLAQLPGAGGRRFGQFRKFGILGAPGTGSPRFTPNRPGTNAPVANTQPQTELTRTSSTETFTLIS